LKKNYLCLFGAQIYVLPPTLAFKVKDQGQGQGQIGPVTCIFDLHT